MLEFLPWEVREVLTQYEFIRKYLEGSLSRKKFLEGFEEFKSELSSKIPKIYLDALDGYNIERIAGYNMFAKYALNNGLAIASIEDKIAWIRGNSKKRIFLFLSAANKLLLSEGKFARWIGRSIKTLGFKNEVVNLEPPDSSHLEFEKFLDLIKGNINKDNAHLWAAKLYIAIVFAHMFPDGNGRLAKQVYYLLRSSGTLDEKRASEGAALTAKFCDGVNMNAAYNVLMKEGIAVRKHSDVTKYRAVRDDDDKSGIVAALKFVAARRIMKAHAAWHLENRNIVYGVWPNKWMSEFLDEYQKARIAWFWEGLGIIDKNPEWAVGILDKALIK